MKLYRIARLLILLPLPCLLLISTTGCVPKNQSIPQSGSAPVPADIVEVDKSFFGPDNVIVAAGSSVTWTNLDEVSYFIVDNDQTFAFNLPAEGSFTMSFNETGIYHYHCGIHPYMQGTITVVNGTSCWYQTDSGQRRG